MKKSVTLFTLILLFLTTSIHLAAGEKFSLPYEKYTLPNGLDVIFHLDKSDPLVAVAIQYHVGSNREVPGKTGFAHVARSSFSGGRQYGEFSASSSVRSTATLESVQIFRDEMEKYIKNISAEDLEFTKNALIKSYARDFETLDAKLGILNNIGFYNKPVDYIRQEQAFIRALTPSMHNELASKFIHPDKLYYVVAGDAETQLSELEKAGLGKPVLIK